MKTFLLIVLFLVSQVVEACSCMQIQNLSEKREAEFLKSEFVFIGNVVSIESEEFFSTFSIIVIEAFKGNISEGDTLKGKNRGECSPSIDTKGRWLIYARKSDKYLEPNNCGLTRSFNRPERATPSQIYTKPYPHVSNIDSLMLVVRSEEWKKKSAEAAKIYLEEEVEILRGNINRVQKNYTKESILTMFSSGNTFPDGLLSYYLDFVNSIDNIPNLGMILQSFCLGSGVIINPYEARNQGDKYRGADLNIHFMLNDFKAQIIDVRHENLGGHFIRTETSILWFVETKDQGWKMYKYLDRPLK